MRLYSKLPLAACTVMVGFGIIVGMTKPICIMALAALLAPYAAVAERFVAPPVAMPDCAGRLPKWFAAWAEEMEKQDRSKAK